MSDEKKKEPVGPQFWPGEDFTWPDFALRVFCAGVGLTLGIMVTMFVSTKLVPHMEHQEWWTRSLWFLIPPTFGFALGLAKFDTTKMWR